MSCEKASRRLRLLLSKAKRLGLGADEVVELPGAKKLLSVRMTSASTAWTISAILALALGIILIFFCAPCAIESKRG